MGRRHDKLGRGRTLSGLGLGALLQAALSGCGGLGGPGGPGGEGVLLYSAAISSLGPTFGDRLAVGDWNRDGKLDVVTGGRGLGLLFGADDGAFQAGTAANIAGVIGEIAVGDFNGDGIHDFSATVASPDLIATYTGKGDGAFSNPMTTPVGRFPSPMLSRDFNGDGKGDLAVGVAFEPTLSIYLSGGGAAKTYPASLPSALCAADLNGDGKVDLVLGEAPSAKSFLRIFLGDGQGGFTPGERLDIGGPELQTVAPGDVNGDGKVDLLAHAGFDKLALFLGKGDGTFTAAARVPTSERLAGVRKLVIADLNGGGRQDLAVLHIPGAGPAFLSLLLGRGDGTFLPPVTFGEFNTGGVSRAGLEVLDLNGDGRLDLLVADGPQVTAFLKLPR